MGEIIKTLKTAKTKSQKNTHKHEQKSNTPPPKKKQNNNNNNKILINKHPQFAEKKRNPQKYPPKHIKEQVQTTKTNPRNPQNPQKYQTKTNPQHFYNYVCAYTYIYICSL